MRFFNALKNSLRDSFTLDERSLALYRFFLGLMVVLDVILRWGDSTDFYTDMGLVPRTTFLSELAMPWSFSFHLSGGGDFYVKSLFVLHLIFGLMMVLGYKTRWALFGAYLMTVSVHNRNWLVNNGGDDILRSILFLSIFLPLNRCFSLDHALKKVHFKSKGVLSTWGLTFFFQVFVIYFVSYIFKDSPIWRSDFTAFFYSSRLDIFATSIGIWLRDFELFGKFLTLMTITMEYFGPVFLIFSFLFFRYWWVVRVSLVWAFILFHLGIILTMNIGLFPYICISMWMIFLPAPFWDKLQGFFKKKKFHELTLYYDEECGFCFKGVRILKEFFLFQEVKILPAQSEISIVEDMKRMNSWVVVNHKGERFFHYSGFLEILRHSPHGRILLFFFGSKPVVYLGQKIYHWVSHHRSFMGTFTQYLDLEEPKKELPLLIWARELLGGFFFITLFMWNLTTIKKFDIKSPFFQQVTQWAHLYQEWNMFAPFPKMDNVWIEVPAILSDGSEIELLTGSRNIYDLKDQNFYDHIPNERWRKFYLNVSEKEDNARYFAGYLCRKWNLRNIKFIEGVTLRKLEVNVFSRLNLVNGDRGEILKKSSWRHWCFDEDYKKENPKK